MPRRARRAAPAAEGTWERFLESVTCHEDDPFPRILLLFPLCIGLVFGFVFTLHTALEGAPGVKPAFAAAGFSAAAGSAAYCCAGAPVFRRAGGCRAGCAALAEGCCRRWGGGGGGPAAPALRAVVVEGPLVPAGAA